MEEYTCSDCKYYEMEYMGDDVGYILLCHKDHDDEDGLVWNKPICEYFELDI